jgi:hypothetical protein
MKFEFEVEEARELMVYVIDRLAEEAGLPEGDAAALRQWRAGVTPGSEAMRELLGKMNADLSRALENAKRSSVRKPDWR